MNTNQVCPTRPNCSKPLPVRLDPMPVDERAVYVHSVCAVLIDSRFGPGRTPPPFVVHLSEYPEPAVLFDLTSKRMVYLDSLPLVGRCGYQVVEAEYQKAKHLRLVSLSFVLGRIKISRPMIKRDFGITEK